MKLSTKKFIIKLLEQELSSEIINENINVNEVEYVKDLIEASKNFVNLYGDWCDRYSINSKIKELLNE